MSDCLHLERQHSYYLPALNSLYSHTRPLTPTATYCTCHLLTHPHTHTCTPLSRHMNTCPFISSWDRCSCHSIILAQCPSSLLAAGSELLCEQEQVYPALPRILVVTLNQSPVEKCTHFSLVVKAILQDTRELNIPSCMFILSFTSHSRI